ncbi:unnamed protein product [Adineta ricciae]|uniref:CxC5 like cysteine cluster associated with KDZ domain-containing protein n=1 Tax=Adineta ricciae TaxID=249248 RepID=A0A815KSB2_ADIRI|nr:unnamed protein product [Adineta ricciae]
MPNGDDVLEALRSSIGLVSLVYICRLYMKLSTFPSIILPSTARTHLIKQAVTDRYNNSHTTEDIIMVTNMIEINKDFIDRVLLLSDMDRNSITLDINHITMDVLNDMILFPFTNICIDCTRSLTSYRYKSVHIIDCFKTNRAVAVTAECKTCTLIYNHSSWYSLKYRWRKINNSSLNSILKVFYLCDSFGFTYSVFFDYTCQLLHDQCPFQSFSRILIDRYNYEHQNNNIILQPIPLAKLFQSHSLLYQIVRFEFMLGKTRIVNLPVSLNRNELNYHFECYSGWWHHLFTTFWSRHKSIPNIKCSPSDCSRCVIVDGHQKCRRLVCSFKNIVDTSIEEMTSVEIGCPYTPCRRMQSSDSVDAIYCRYHQPSILLSPSLDLQKASERAAEFSTIMNSDHPSHEGRFVGLNSQAAEQAFQYISRAKFALRNFSFPHSTAMLLIMLHLLNCKMTGINSEIIGVEFLHFGDIIKDFFATPCIYERFGTLNGEELSKDDDDDQSDLDHNITFEDMP